MISNYMIVCFLINIIIGLGIPIGSLFYLIRKRHKCIKPYFIGVLVFLISQIFLRIPLINNVLAYMEWFNYMTIFYPIAYILFLGFSAGIFEEIGRYLGFKIALKNNRRWIDGISFGLGHGGIEAVLFLGIPSIQNLFTSISLNNGTYLEGNIESIKALYLSTSNINVLMGSVERILAIIMHVGLTLIVLYGINKKQIRYLLLAILIHGSANSISVICLNFGMNVFIVEGIIGIFSLGLLIFIIKSKALFKKVEGV